MENETRALLRKVVEIYANTPPTHLDELKETLVQMEVETPGSLSFYVPGFGYIDFHIETIFKLDVIGAEKARRIYENPMEKDAFLKTVDGYIDGPQFQANMNREIFDNAFSDLYGWVLATDCPCSLDRAAVLEKKGLICNSEDLREVKWKNGKGRGSISCLECQHLHFTAILESLSNGKYDYMADIIKGYHKTTVRQVEWCSKKHPLKIIEQYDYVENQEAFPSYLKGFPCNALIDLLSSDPQEASRIKKCPICNRFFFANDARRKKCENPDCFTEYKRQHKQHQREVDPGRYI